jgi:glycosyltransferase involved in cell wall biosynthesis
LRRVLVLLASLNEEEGMGPTLAELSRVLEKPAFLVVDGKSTDRTTEIAKESGAEILIQKGKGKGNAIAQAISHVNGDIEYVILVDADFSYPAEHLPRMIRILDENPQVGMVCGNRFNSHFRLKSMHSMLYLGNRLIAFAHNLLNGIQMRDPLTGLRVVRWKVLKNWKPKSESFDIEVELNHYVERQGYGIVEIPISYRPRLGEKKLKPKHGVTILKRILAETMY